MAIISDLQIHSKYSRATSKEISFENLEKYARIKGLDLLGTGDFQHPLQFKSIKAELKEDEKGILWSKTGFPFLWQTEISLIYTQNGKGQRIHHLIFSPNKEVAQQIIDSLSKKGRLDYDGRPISGFSSVELVDMMREISEGIEIIPAHIWTSHFSLMGEYNQLSKVEDCFKDNTKYIHALETGMSSNPADNWRISNLDKFQLVSFSDSHCVHPDTFVTLGDGYVLPIGHIAKELIVAHADFNNMSYKNGVKIQNSKIFSPPLLKHIKYSGGEIKVSENHCFYVFDGKNVVEKNALELRKGDMLLRVARISHEDKGSIKLKKPDFNIYYRLKGEGLNFIKQQRNKHGYLQRELADLLGLYIDHYWKIEKGHVKLSKKILKQLSRILHFDFNNFVQNMVSDKFPTITFPDKSSKKLFELIGYYTGDGCYTKINRGACLLLTDKNLNNLKYYQKIIENLFSCKCRLFKYSYQNSYGLFIPSLVAKFFSLNFPELILKSNRRIIPRRFYSAPLNEISGFLRGFFDAEGCVGHHNVDACSANKLLLYQIDSLLKKFGIFSSLYLNQLEKTKQKYRHRIMLYSENLRKFNDKINFNHRIKKLKLKAYVENLRVKRASKIKKIGDFILSEIKSIVNINSDVTYLYDISVPGFQNYIANQVIVHNSHWPWRLGREATIFDFKELSYENFLRAIRTGEGLKMTFETPTAYGKYHFSGHRNCGIVVSPEESKKLNRVCPKCGQKLTIGVADRIEQLGDRPKDYKRENAIPFISLIPLHELISAVYNYKQLYSKKIWEIYNKLISRFDSEFNVLLNANEKDLLEILDKKLVDVILLNRECKLEVKPGYDGIYGQIILNQNETIKGQKSLAEF